MISLSEYRRKKALHMNATIDKRLSRKLEYNLGWSDKTEVFMKVKFFLTGRRCISSHCLRHITVSETLRYRNNQLMWRQILIRFFHQLRLHPPCLQWIQWGRRYQIVTPVDIVNVMDVVVVYISIEHSLPMRKKILKRLNFRPS